MGHLQSFRSWKSVGMLALHQASAGRSAARALGFRLWKAGLAGKWRGYARMHEQVALSKDFTCAILRRPEDTARSRWQAVHLIDFPALRRNRYVAGGCESSFVLWQVPAWQAGTCSVSCRATRSGTGKIL